MSEALRSVIIGCGGIAQVHKQVLMSIPESCLAACCDIKPDRAEKMAQECSITPYTDAEEMIIREKPDVVHICVPHPLHTPLAEMAVSHGANVFTEKPPVVSREQWQRFENLENSGKHIGICFQNRYNSATQLMKKILASPESGKVLGARAFVTWCRKPPYYLDSDWRGSWSTEGGGVLINQSIHTLDLLTYLLGKPEDVECSMHNHSLKKEIEVEDTVEAYITFQSGVNALFYATNSYCMDAPVMVDVECENVSLHMAAPDLEIRWKDGKIEHPEFAPQQSLGKDYWGTGHLKCIEDFYRSIMENRPFMNDIASVKDTMDLMLRMYEPFTGKKIM